MSNEITQVSCKHTDVLVVGYGPVGAALAALLGRFGVRALVIDKGQDVLMMPRAIALDNEALRVLQMVGLDDQSFERIGIQQVQMHSPFLGQFGRVNTMGTIDGHPKLVTFYQPDLEKALRNKVSEYPNITVLCQCELLELEQLPDKVSAIARTADGLEERISARYVVGADGASSRVRELIGLSFGGETYSEDWLIVDANNRENQAIDHVEFLCDPKRPTPHMPAPGGRERWEFMLLPGEKREQMEKPETIARLLSPWIKAEELNIERQAVYRFHARCCDRFQKGRIFLVGDAAHITPPFVGQGLVAGLRDVANLSWKLAAVIQYSNNDKILDSYDQERRPHAQEMINLAKFMGKLVMPRTAAKAMAVHGLMRFCRLIPPLRLFFEELKVKPMNRFKHGLFVPGRSKVKLQRGGQFPQSWVRSSTAVCLSDELFGDCLTLVGIGVDPADVLNPGARENWEKAGGKLLHLGLRGQPAGGCTQFAEILSDDLVIKAPGGWLAVVRPDGVVVHDGPPHESDSLVAESLHVLLN